MGAISQRNFRNQQKIDDRYVFAAATDDNRAAAGSSPQQFRVGNWMARSVGQVQRERTKWLGLAGGFQLFNGHWRYSLKNSASNKAKPGMMSSH